MVKFSIHLNRHVFIIIHLISGLDTLGRFSFMFFKGDNFCDFLFAFLHSVPSEKGSTPRKNEFATNGRKFCSFNSSPANGDFCHLLITFANSLDPDQARQKVRPDLDPNGLIL